MLATLRTGGIDFRCVPILGVVEKAEGPECGTEPGQATVSSRFPGPRKRVRSYKVRDQTRLAVSLLLIPMGPWGWRWCVQENVGHGYIFLSKAPGQCDNIFG